MRPNVSSLQVNKSKTGQRSLLILGTRGIPANHGGFETFAEQLSLHLTAAGWKVTVYCQEDGVAGRVVLDEWQGVQRAIVPVRPAGPVGSLIFDWKSLRHALRQDGLILILGYNTGIFTLLPRLLGRAVVLNMDGIEWKRAKWSRPIKAWFWLNERVAAWAGTTLIADHPEIKAHLATRVSQAKITVIPYAADAVAQAEEELLQRFALTKWNYLLTVCRLEPENGVLEIVRAFSKKKRGRELVVLGKLDRDNAYHRELQVAAGPEVIFPGPVYEKDVLAALRFHARAYCHGHRRQDEIRLDKALRSNLDMVTLVRRFVLHSAIIGLSLATLARPMVAGTYTVNSTADLPDADPADGVCRTASNNCTLRAAIMQADFAGPATIILPAGTYTLTRPGYDDDALVGDLDIKRDLIIQGAGSATTIVDGNGSVTHDRVFQVLSTVQNVTLSGMTIRNGESLNRYPSGLLGAAVSTSKARAKCT